MPNTVLMASQPGEAGVAHVVADQVSWVTEAGWAAVVACDPDSVLAELVQQRGGAVAPWRATRSPGPSVISEARAFRRIFGSTGPDLVHLHSSKAGLVGRLVVRGRRPTLFQPHAWSFDAVDGASALPPKLWERLATRWTDTTVCVSRAEQEQGRQLGIPADSVVVLPNVVDLDRFRPAERSAARALLAAELGEEIDGPLAVCVGRLCRQKGQDLLLAAWPSVVDAVPGARLALVGDGPDREQLASSAPGSVLFAGDRRDPVPWLQAADVVVVPSRWEGQALVLLEAMACGVPVVASDIAANTETLPITAGATVPAADSAALTAALVERLEPGQPERRSAEGRSGRDHVVAHHDPAAAARALVQVYQRLVRPGADASSGAG